jgi:hypothetical protein
MRRRPIGLCCAIRRPTASGSGEYEATLGPPNQLIVAYQCQAGALPTAASVLIRCGVNKFGGLALPGQFVLYNEGEIIPNAPFSVCWTATATYFDGSTLSTSDCTPRDTRLFGSDSSYEEG